MLYYKNKLLDFNYKKIYKGNDLIYNKPLPIQYFVVDVSEDVDLTYTINNKKTTVHVISSLAKRIDIDEKITDLHSFLIVMEIGCIFVH